MQAMKKKLHDTAATGKVKPEDDAEAEVIEKADKDAAKVKTGIAPDFLQTETKSKDKENANQSHKPNSDVICNDYGVVMPYPCFTAGNLPGKNLL